MQNSNHRKHTKSIRKVIGKFYVSNSYTASAQSQSYIYFQCTYNSVCTVYYIHLDAVDLREMKHKNHRKMFVCHLQNGLTFNQHLKYIGTQRRSPNKKRKEKKQQQPNNEWMDWEDNRMNVSKWNKKCAYTNMHQRTLYTTRTTHTRTKPWKRPKENWWTVHSVENVNGKYNHKEKE